MSPRPALPLRLEYVLLGLIRRKPMHGYELLQHWNEANGLIGIWHVKMGSLYAALEKLESLGYIDSKMIPGEASPARKEHCITAVGEQAFLEWMQAPVSSARDFRQDFLAKLFFAEDVDPSLVADVIAQQQTTCREWLTSLENQLEGSQGFYHQVLTFRICQVQGMLEWLQTLPKNNE